MLVPLKSQNKSVSKHQSTKWVVVQLSQTGEHEKNLVALEKAVHRSLQQKLAVFIPAATQKAREDNHTMFFMDGYIFVEYKPGVPYGKLINTTYFESVLSGSGKSLHLLDDADLAPMRKGVSTMKVGTFNKGDEVKVTRGTFKNLTGVVSMVYEGREQVQINLNLQSKPMLIDYPQSYLELIPKA